MTRRWLTIGVLLAVLSAGARAATAPPALGPAYVQYGGLELSAAVEPDPPDLFGVVDIMNPTADTVRLRYAGFCELAIVLYPAAASGGAPTWDSSLWWERRQGSCPASPVELDIPPETLARVIAPVIQVESVLGDSLPPGPYTPAVRLRLLLPRDTTFVLRGETIDIARGGAEPLLAQWAD